MPSIVDVSPHPAPRRYPGARSREANESASDERARAIIIGYLGESKAAANKICRAFARQSRDDLPATQADPLTPVPISKVLSEIECEFDGPIHANLESVEPTADAGTLGQVHEATLSDGRRVAIKLQYPGIAEALESELNLAAILSRGASLQRWNYNVKAFQPGLRKLVHQELDYRRECLNQLRFSKLASIPGIVVPQVFPELSTNTLLVQSWEDGSEFDEILDWPTADREKVAKLLLKSCVHGLFRTGLVHADPSPRHYRVRRDEGGEPELVIHDFGCMVDLHPEARIALLRILQALREGSPLDYLSNMAVMGFDARHLLTLQDRLGTLCHLLLFPFIHDRPFALNEWGLSDKLSMLLGNELRCLRNAAPSEFLLLLRLFQGVTHQIAKLGVEFAWWPMLRSVVDPWEMDVARSTLAPPPSFGEEEHLVMPTARYLKIEVLRGDEPALSQSHPWTDLWSLPTMIPDAMRPGLEAQSVDLDRVFRRAVRARCLPHTLFQYEQGEERGRIWIE
jgi:hypothetical protein